MTAKLSISLTDAQRAFASELVEQGRYSSVSAVLQSGLDLLRRETEMRDAEIAALKALLDARRHGPFVAEHEGRARTAAMIAGRRASLGLEG